jgi:hypothetical protein
LLQCNKNPLNSFGLCIMLQCSRREKG